MTDIRTDYRYFSIIPKTHAARLLDGIDAKREDQSKQIEAFRTTYGMPKAMATWMRSGGVVGFGRWSGKEDRAWFRSWENVFKVVKSDGHFVPRRDTPDGKSAYKAMLAIPTVNGGDCLRVAFTTGGLTVSATDGGLCILGLGLYRPKRHPPILAVPRKATIAQVTGLRLLQIETAAARIAASEAD